MRRAHKGRMGLARLGRIGDEAAGAAHQVVVFEPWPTAGAIDGSLCIHVEFQGFWRFSRSGFIAETAPAARRFDVHPAMQRPGLSGVYCDTEWVAESRMDQVVKAERVSARAITGFIEEALVK